MIIPIIIIVALALGGKQIRSLILQAYREKSPLYSEYLETLNSYKSLLETKMTLSQFNTASDHIQDIATSHFRAKNNINNMASTHFTKSNQEFEGLSDEYLDQ